jgi:hypothetical protein
MTDAAPENQTCPFCYAEIDARATVCGMCGAAKYMPPPRWAGIFFGLLLAVFGIAFMSGGGAGLWFACSS